MPKFSDKKIRFLIDKLLQKEPMASSEYIRQRLLILGVNHSCIIRHLDHYYKEGLVDDSEQIEFEIKRRLRESQGFNLISRELRLMGFNDIQVEESLKNIQLDEFECAMKCKLNKFGKRMPNGHEDKSRMVFYLQKMGHKLPSIFKVIGINNKMENA